MGKAVDLLNDNINRQSTATAGLIIQQNAMIAALQQRVGNLEDELNSLLVRVDRVDPPSYTPRAEVIDLTDDSDNDIVEVVPEVRKWACDCV